MASSNGNPWEKKGGELQKRMENPGYYKNVIKKGTLSIADLDEDSWSIVNDRQHLPEEECGWIKSLDLPPNRDQKGISPYRNVMYLRRDFPAMTLTGKTGPGVIFIEVINRMAGNDFYISDLMKLVYEQNFPLQGLKYIFARTVINIDTTVCYQNICQAHGISFQAKNATTWDSGSKEFKALLGCGIGKTMASFILCAFGQGVKRIARIMLWRENYDLNMRFDIESV